MKSDDVTGFVFAELFITNWAWSIMVCTSIRQKQKFCFMDKPNLWGVKGNQLRNVLDIQWGNDVITVCKNFRYWYMG